MTQVSEKRHINGRCCLCGSGIQGYGNNASPVSTGRCCNDCNAYVVIPVRISMLFPNAKKKEG